MSYRTWRQFKIDDFLIDFKHNIKTSFEGYPVPFAERRVLLLLIDALLVALAVWSAYQLRQFTVGKQTDFIYVYEHRYWLPLIVLSWWVIASFNDLYDIPSSYDRVASAMRFVIVGLLGFAICSVAAFLFPNTWPKLFFIYFLAIAVPLNSLGRFLYIHLSRTFSSAHRILIVGAGTRGQAIAQLLHKHGVRLHYQVLGYVNDNPLSAPANMLHLPVLGQVTDLPHLAQQHQAHEIVIALQQDVTQAIFHLLVDCQAQGVQISWMPELYGKLCRRIPIEHIDPTWAMYAIQGQPIFSRLQLISKRALDLLIVLFNLPIFGLLIPLLALAIRLDSPGPVFYRQVRSGRGGKPFSIYKFRTMVIDAEKDGKPRWAIKGDRRITRVGHFLRKTRLDELPQMLNILKGEMSLVGPRPERPEFVKELQKTIPFYQVRLMVKPGLTGWAQVHYDYGNTVEDALRKLQYDFYYVRYWSLALDLYTIFQTVAVVFKLKGI